MREFAKRQQKGGLETADNLKKRQDFLRELSSFRPKESVFEAFHTGGGKDVGVVSHLDKGRTTGKKHDNSVALSAMKNMRRQMRIARDKGLWHDGTSPGGLDGRRSRKCHHDVGLSDRVCRRKTSSGRPGSLSGIGGTKCHTAQGLLEVNEVKEKIVHPTRR